MLFVKYDLLGVFKNIESVNNAATGIVNRFLANFLQKWDTKTIMFAFDRLENTENQEITEDYKIFANFENTYLK